MIKMNNPSNIMDGMLSITTEQEGGFFQQLNNFIEGYATNWKAVALNQALETFLTILNRYSSNLKDTLQQMPWPIRTKEEIRMYFTLFRDELLTAKEKKQKFPKESAEMLLLVIKSLIPATLVLTEENDLQVMRRGNLIKSVQSEEGDLSMVRNGLLQDFGITEQRNIGAPQFCIKKVIWNPRESMISFNGCAWAAIPIGVYRQNGVEEEQEIQVFKDNYPVMMQKLQTALQVCNFEIVDCGIGLSFTVQFTPDQALQHIKNWFKICLFSAGTALLEKVKGRYQNFMRNSSMIGEFETTWDKNQEVPIVNVKITDTNKTGLLYALTTSKENNHLMLQGLMRGLGWKLNDYSSGKLLQYTCTRPLWSLIHGLGCWMSANEIAGLEYDVDPSSSYRNYVVSLQNEIGIWSSECRPNSLVYRPDNPNFTEEGAVGLHYHIHVFKGDNEFEGGKGFPMGNYPTAAPLWQGFNIYQELKK